MRDGFGIYTWEDRNKYKEIGQITNNMELEN